MHYRHYSPPPPLEPAHKVLAQRVALVLFVVSATWGTINTLFAAPPALYRPDVRACMMAGNSVPTCVDVTRSQGDWRN